MKHVTYKTTGTCSQFINVDVDDEGRIQEVSFIGGCNGNLQGIASLVRGMRVEDVKEKLNGIRCGYKNTSCPDQLVRALEQLSQE
ncbi:MAG: TIGR03905 family TSCPD domain-containing protein [Prevotella sp.]|nr:TIGR03905 family TSCPD domain-containing protein [Prevotella sp.]